MGLKDGIRRGRGVVLHLEHTGIMNTGFDVVEFAGARVKPVKPRKATGRNDPCHCGSGKKFKRCHGANKR